MINWFIKWISEYVNYSPNDYPNIKFNWLNEYWMNEYSMSATSNYVLLKFRENSEKPEKS